MRRNGVDRCRSVATEACRRAANCDGFLTQVAERTGLRIETISSGEEARLALRGCMPLLPGGAPRALGFDIGGGSPRSRSEERRVGKEGVRTGRSRWRPGP